MQLSLSHLSSDHLTAYEAQALLLEDLRTHPPEAALHQLGCSLMTELLDIVGETALEDFHVLIGEALIGAFHSVAQRIERDADKARDQLGGLVRDKMKAEPRSRALFVFVGKRGHTMKVLTWDGTGSIVIHKKLDAGKFELPRATSESDQHVVVSDAIFEVIYKGVSTTPRAKPRRTH